jgi:hypothetical protein
MIVIRESARAAAVSSRRDPSVLPSSTNTTS